MPVMGVLRRARVLLPPRPAALPCREQEKFQEEPERATKVGQGRDMFPRASLEV